VEFVNKVAESGIITLDLEQFLPQQEIVAFDLKDYLFMGLILKEKDFREQLKNLDTTAYTDKIVAVHCSADAIIPQWAYMLVTTRLHGIAAQVKHGTAEQVSTQLLSNAIATLDVAPYTDARIVVKGCGDKSLPDAAYLAITQALLPVAKSIMYGEPCSTVPVYKKKATTV
jgi:hypothetical protein